MTMQSGNDGRCWVYGCPLPGSLGRVDEWVCFAHHDAAASDLQAITAVLHRLRAVGESALDIRLFYGTDDWVSAYRGIQRRLREAGMDDMLFGEADSSPYRPERPIVKQWLARLEGCILHACDEVKSARSSRFVPHTVPTAAVSGPTHIAYALPYRDDTREAP